MVCSVTGMACQFIVASTALVDASEEAACPHIHLQSTIKSSEQNDHMFLVRQAMEQEDRDKGVDMDLAGCTCYIH